MAEERDGRDPTSLDFYIQFEYLSSRDFGALLMACSSLSESAYRTYSEASPGVWAQPPDLELIEVRTGESIKFKFVERAIPTISSDKDNDIVIGVPKKLGVPVLMAALLLNAADKAMDMRNKYYDGEIKKIELQLKQEEINKIRRGEGKAPEQLERQAQVIVVSLLNNPLFKSVGINGVLIKGPHLTEPEPRKSSAA